METASPPVNHVLLSRLNTLTVRGVGFKQESKISTVVSGTMEVIHKELGRDEGISPQLTSRLVRLSSGNLNASGLGFFPLR